MPRRTIIQLALLTIGVIVWGYGSRVDDSRLTWIGLGFFAAAAVMRLFNRRSRESERGEGE